MNSEEPPVWLLDARKCLTWFVTFLGEEEWNRRRAKVVAHFKLVEKPLPQQPSLEEKSKDIYRPLALYTDWIAWYMYLVENQGIRPACDEPHQSARILPFFASIGRQINVLQQIKGVEDRLQELLSPTINQADSTFFELLVAACYAKNGWSVEFLKEARTQKTPDLLVKRGSELLFVECKRMAKATDYAERERLAWQQRWRNLVGPLSVNLPPIHFSVTFHVEVEKIDPYILSELFASNGGFEGKKKFSVNRGGVSVIARPIDMMRVRSHFDQYDVRSHSPQMTELLAGNYSPFKSYTHKVAPTGMVNLGPDDGLHCCNTFFDGVGHAYSAEWKCIAKESFWGKAKDIKKNLSKAISQIPDDSRGVVHIGYETLESRMVEFLRQSRIGNSLRKFDCGPKEIQVLYLHALQCVPSTVEAFECAETTLSFKQRDLIEPKTILSNDYLLEQDATEGHQSTHWKQDYNVGME